MARDCGSAFSQANVHEPDAPPRSSTHRTWPGWISWISGSADIAGHHVHRFNEGGLVRVFAANARPGEFGTSGPHGPRQSRPAPQTVRLVLQHGHDALRMCLAEIRETARQESSTAGLALRITPTAARPSSTMATARTSQSAAAATSAAVRGAAARISNRSRSTAAASRQGT